MPKSTASGYAEATDRQIVTALVRGLNLLSCFRVERPLLTNAEMSRLSGLPRSSVSRLTHTLVKEGYLEYVSDHRAYRLAAKVLSIGHAMLGGLLLRSIALPHMHKMAELTNSQVAIAACEDSSMLIIEVATADTMQAFPMEVGARMAVDMTAMGRAYLASSSVAERERITHHLIAERRRNPEALKNVVDRSLEEFKRYGFCTSINEWRSGVNGVAVPLYLRDIGRRLVLTCGGVETQLTDQNIYKNVGPMLISVAELIKQACDHRS